MPEHEMKNGHAFVISHLCPRGTMPEIPWLDEAYAIDSSDCVVLSYEDWRALADGDAAIWSALERKLLIGFYLNEPQLIAVVGHSNGLDDPASTAGQHDVDRIVRRVESLLLPAAVLGFWINDQGDLDGTAGPELDFTEREHAVAEREPAA